jgi:hypothetical protein
MLIVDVSAVKLLGEAKQNNLPPEYVQPIDGEGMLVLEYFVPVKNDQCTEHST